MEIVINKCYGGFGLSNEAERAYLARQGKEAFFYTHVRGGTGNFDFTRYVRATDESFMTYTFTQDMGDEFGKEDFEESKGYFYCREIERTDPDLVAVVKELGPKANGRHAKLAVVEIPDGIEWEIEEYDGIEWVAEKHRTWS